MDVKNKIITESIYILKLYNRGYVYEEETTRDWVFGKTEAFKYKRLCALRFSDEPLLILLNNKQNHKKNIRVH
jgi:hypothetical protein